MVQAIRQEVTVQQGSVIEIHSPMLKPGTHVEVIVLLEDTATKKQKLRSLIGAGKGCFSSPKEVDEFISKERNRWE